MTKVLIAEDERPIARLLEMNLTRAAPCIYKDR